MERHLVAREIGSILLAACGTPKFIESEEDMRLHVIVMMTAALVLSVSPASAGQRSGKKAAQHATCDGLRGAARGLCKAYCIARACAEHPERRACHRLRANFERKTGLSSFPCDLPEPADEPPVCDTCPMACDTGADPVTGDPWVVCDGDEDTAWISHATPAGGVYRADLICQELGYTHVSQHGATWGSVCGYDDGATSCENPGQRVFDGANLCADPFLCLTVMWECAR
jgi:hypothetical protein